MVPGDRSSTGGSTRAFDFNSQAGVLAVLGAIRVSTLSPADRSELRDLVFLYSNGGGDQAVRNVLEERLAAFSITPDAIPVPTVTSVQAAPVYAPGFAGSRPSPVFAPTASIPVLVTSQTAAPISDSVQVLPAAVAVPVPVAQSTPVTVASQPNEPVVVVQPAPIVTIPVRQMNVMSTVDQSNVVPPVAIPTPTPVQTPVARQPIVPIQPVVTPVTPATVAPVVPSVTPEPISSAVEARLERIRTIKSEVNGRVGNPVNLVDIDNALGREYMSALLEAMKLLSSASDAESSRAMMRLETVFAQVVSLLDADRQPVVASPVAVVPEMPIAPVAVVPTVPVVPIAPQSPVMSVPVSVNRPSSVVVPVVPEPLVTPTFPVRSNEVAAPLVQPWAQADTFAAHVSIPVAPIQTPAPVPLPEPEPVPTQFTGVTAVPALRMSSESTIEPQPEAIVAVSSVASSQPPLRTLSELPTADEVLNSSVAGDPLYTKEVDDGLNQLLSEWTLFKKSGLFGTGPNGRQHPLFIKIAPLQITLLLAGRFEGATQEIKQSITDYMNGWRYEQGIIYNQGETFEQYLRRVIRHIIDLQNKKRRP